MKKIIITVLITFAVLIAGVFTYIKSGSYDISQLNKHDGLTKWMIRQTTKKSIKKRMFDNSIPSNINDSALLITGFSHYNAICVQCHGAPGVKEWEMVEGLYPNPPKMYKHKGQENMQEFFWIIKNGIKMTSMPAYGPTYDDQSIWAMTAFVTEKLNKMSPEEYQDWSKKYGEEGEEMETTDHEGNE